MTVRAVMIMTVGMVLTAAAVMPVMMIVPMMNMPMCAYRTAFGKSRCHHKRGAGLRSERTQKPTALAPCEPRAESRDEPVTRDLDDALGPAHLTRRDVEDRRTDADDRDRHQRLHQGGRERERDAAPRRLFIRDEIG